MGIHLDFVKRNKYWIMGLMACLVVGAIFGYKFLDFGIKNIEIVKLHPAVSSYTFINPLLGVELSNDSESSDYAQLSKQLKVFISKKINSQGVENISYYLRDLEGGKWIGQGEDNYFHAASLFKVPVMMAYFQAAQKNSRLLSQNIYVNNTANIINDSKLEQSVIKPGEYTIEQLINDMIIYSDNTAKDILLTAAEKNFGIDYKSLQNVFTYLGVFNQENKEQQLIISPKIYSLFFRVMYNATFLDKDTSEKALNLLTQTKFNEGLVAGLSKDVKVSHKFGYHIDPQTKKQELHDCGIIYLPGHPYFLCVMTRGNNLDELKNSISVMSQTAYEYFKKNSQ